MITFLNRNTSLLNVANNWIISKSCDNNMYLLKWSILMYILLFWLQITVRTVTCFVYEPVSRNIKQIYEHSDIYNIKRHIYFWGFWDTKDSFKGISILTIAWSLFNALKHACWRPFISTTSSMNKMLCVWRKHCIDFYIKWVCTISKAETSVCAV